MHNWYIFDFDYTLFKTSETVLIWSPRGDSVQNGKKCFRLLPSLFSHYKKADDEIINEESFVNFYSIDFQKAKPILPVLEIFNLVKNKKILSARPQEAAKDFYKTMGQDAEFIGLKDSSANRKLNYILNFDNVLVFEDSPAVIELLRSHGIDCVLVSSETDDKTMLFYHYNNKAPT
jgi:hypothetical protein